MLEEEGKEKEEEGGGGQKGRPQEGRRAGKSSSADCGCGGGHVFGRAGQAAQGVKKTSISQDQ